MRPSAGDSTARGSSGTSRGGSRKNCRMNSASSQQGTDHHHPAKRPTRTETATATPRKGQPSRAMIGCGYGGLTRYFGTLSPQAASSNATTSSASILRSVDKTVPLYPGHHFAQPRADLLDRQLRGHAPAAEEHRRPRAVFQHELLGVLARLDAREHAAHALARRSEEHTSELQSHLNLV